MNRKLQTLLLFSTLAWPAMASVPSRLEFIADDYAKARAEANERQVPLFVEVWAPW